MKKFIKTASLVFYFLSFIIFFFIGVLFAGIINAAEGQGLAGSAIVLAYGVLFGFISFLFALLAVYFLPIKSIIKFNWFLFLLFLFLIGTLVIRQKIRKNKKLDSANQTYSPAANYCMVSGTYENSKFNKKKITPGLGFFKPDFVENPVLYFLWNPNTKKVTR